MDAAQFQDRMQRIEELIAAIQEHANPVVRASAVELVRALLDVHRAGLEQTFEQILHQGEPGQEARPFVDACQNRGAWPVLVGIIARIS